MENWLRKLRQKLSLSHSRPINFVSNEIAHNINIDKMTALKWIIDLAEIFFFLRFHVKLWKICEQINSRSIEYGYVVKRLIEYALKVKLYAYFFLCFFSFNFTPLMVKIKPTQTFIIRSTERYEHYKMLQQTWNIIKTVMYSMRRLHFFTIDYAYRRKRIVKMTDMGLRLVHSIEWMNFSYANILISNL